MSSEVEEKRQLIKLVLQNVRLDGKKLVYDVHKPFDEMLNARDGNSWSSLIDTLIDGNFQYSFTLHRIQAVFSVLKLEFDI